MFKKYKKMLYATQRLRYGGIRRLAGPRVFVNWVFASHRFFHATFYPACRKEVTE